MEFSTERAVFWDTLMIIFIEISLCAMCMTAKQRPLQPSGHLAPPKKNPDKRSSKNPSLPSTAAHSGGSNNQILNMRIPPPFFPPPSFCFFPLLLIFVLASNMKHLPLLKIKLNLINNFVLIGHLLCRIAEDL